MIRLGVLGSTRGTAMLALQEAIAAKRVAANIQVVMSNKSDAMILTRAASLGLPNQFVDGKSLSRTAYDQLVSEVLTSYGVELIVLIGYMRILSKEFVATWRDKIINVHPSLLPAFAGKMDLAVHEAVLAAKVKQSGCTVHMVTEEVDAGPIVTQQMCEVKEDDTPQSLKQRVQLLEGPAIVSAINLITNFLRLVDYDAKNASNPPYDHSNFS